MSTSFYHLFHGTFERVPSRIKRPIKRTLSPFFPKPQACLVSYPKCGRTWLRLMIGAAAQEHLKLPVDDPTDIEAFSRFTDAFPTMRVTHDTEAAAFLAKLRPWMYQGSKVIFLARDPRDVMVSFFHHQANRMELGPLLPGLTHFETMEEMVDTNAKGGLRAILAFYNQWARILPKGSLVTHYEDIKARPEMEVRRCLQFLGLTRIPDSIVARAVEQGAFHRMRAAERAGSISHHRLRPGDPANPESFKVRKGKVGGYRDELSPAAVARMDDIISAELSPAFVRYKYRT